MHRGMMECPWSCIVFTCSDIAWSRILKKTLVDLKNMNKIGSISNETVILAATDPEPNIGSGAATLNALFVVTEYLSAQKDYTVVTSDVLQNTSILILHHGRDYVYDIGGKGLISVPEHGNSNSLSNFNIQNNLEHLVNLMSSLKNKNNCSGIWVCSTDTSFVYLDSDILLSQNLSEDCTMFCVSSDLTYASHHGVVVSDNSGIVQNISYCASEEYLGEIAKNDQVKVVSGIVYFPLSVAEKLLYFHTVAPLNCCTYMGIDSGSEPLKLSLFFDILVAMVRNIPEEVYLSGQYGNLYNVKTGLDQQSKDALYTARKVIWCCLSKFTLKCVTLCNVKHCYWDERLSAQHHKQNLIGFGRTGLLQSFVHCNETTFLPNFLAINCLISCQSILIQQNSVICNSKIKCGKISIGNNCYISSINIDMPNSMSFLLPDRVCFLGFEQASGAEEKVHVIFGVEDDLHKEVDIELDMYCGLPWKEVFQITGLTPGDIWKDVPKTLWHANIYSHSLGISFYVDLLSGNYENMLQLNWKEIPRCSIYQLVKTVNMEKEVLWRQEIKSEILCSQISESIEKNTDMFFLPLFKLACSEGWHLEVLKVLDNTAIKLEKKNFELCRTLSCIADLLGTMAGTMGRVRSGPGNNKAWITAFEYLRNEEPGKAIIALRDMRDTWLSSNLVVRAARHYESALQIFIQNAVKSAKGFWNLSSCTLPAIGQWVTAECPVRVDLQGGWSDTPPICYEQGGSVVNIAVNIDGKKPVGAKAKRIDSMNIFFKVQNQDFCKELEIKSLADLADFNQVYANSALLKAAVVCAEIVDLNSCDTLEKQLERFQSGFEIHVWSLLPQGSGLGTSSILAGAIIAALWTVSGRIYTKRCILHAVLYLEQLLTTGGGWQDQVGGIMGGVNRGYSNASLPLEIKVDHIPVSERFLQVLNSHLFLIYTGKVRLAKNLLQNVIRNWYAREEQIVQCFRNLVVNSYISAEAFVNEDLQVIGQQMNKYWEQKKVLASGCEPAEVQQLMKHLDALAYGKLLVGAGGGGFMCILTKEPSSVQDIVSKCSDLPFAGNLSVHSVNIDLSGLTVKVDDLFLKLA